jgi:hypothetical protein
MDFTEKEYFLSGNMDMIGQVSDVLIKKGVLRENIYFENIYPVLMKGQK